MPDGSTWDPGNGFSNYDNYSSGGGGGGSLQASYGGGISFSGGLGSFKWRFIPSKQRNSLVWDEGDFQIHLPKITGYVWISDPVAMESGFPEMADISWIHQPIDNVYGKVASRSGGKVNFLSAYLHYKFGREADYHIDISKVDFSMLSEKDFPGGVGSIKSLNIL